MPRVGATVRPRMLSPNALPCSYGELPESEKQYDRNTALETLKLIVKLGYRIEKETRG